MAFKPPGGDLTGWSILWIFFGIVATIAGAMSGTAFYFLGTFVGFLAAGMWFEQRWCGYLFACLMVLVILLAILALVMVDETWTDRAYRLLRMALSGYFALITFRWAQRE